MTNQMMDKQQDMTNGVDVTALEQTMKAITEDPVIARFNFRARNRWLGGAHNRTTLDDYSGACQHFSRQQPFVFDCDEPPILLGEDRGANPVEYLLHGLAGCVTTTLAYHAALRGIRLEEVESRLEGDIDLRGLLALDDTTRPGYQGIRMSFRIKSDAGRQQLEELLQSVHGRSPVFDSVRQGVPIQVSLDG